MNIFTDLIIIIGIFLYCYAFYISIKHFRDRFYPVVFKVREYRDGKLTAEYEEHKSSNHRKTPTVNSGLVKEDSLSSITQISESPPVKKIGRPAGATNKKIELEYDEININLGDL